jgi:hypothetical protein
MDARAGDRLFLTSSPARASISPPTANELMR